jgi:hypothetical protein
MFPFISRLKAERSGRKKLPAGFAPLAWAAAAPLGTSTASTAAESAPAAFGFGTRFVDVQRATVQVMTIQGRDRPIRLSGIGHFDESESTRTAGFAVSY